MTGGFEALKWCWDLAFKIEHSDMNTHIKFEQHRVNLLLMFEIIQKRMPPCLHYLTNHFIEDFIRYRRLGLLICEGGESRNSQIKAFKQASSGKRVCFFQIWSKDRNCNLKQIACSCITDSIWRS